MNSPVVGEYSTRHFPLRSTAADAPAIQVRTEIALVRSQTPPNPDVERTMARPPWCTDTRPAPRAARIFPLFIGLVGEHASAVGFVTLNELAPLSAITPPAAPPRRRHPWRTSRGQLIERIRNGPA